MAMDAKERKLLMIRIGAGVAIVLLLIVGAWFMFGSSDEQGTPESQLGPSDSMLPEQGEKTEQGQNVQTPGKITANVNAVNFTQDKPDTIVFTLQALGGPVNIVSAVIPAEDSDALTISNIDCPVIPQQLQANQSCSASVTWNGNRTVNSVLTITTSDSVLGQNGLAGSATSIPPAPNTAGAPTTIPAPAPGTQVLSIAINAVSTKPAAPAEGQAVPPPAEGGGSSAAATPQAPKAAEGMSPIEMMREAYLMARRGVGYNAVQGPTASKGLQASAKSPYVSWDNIGVEYKKSSSPTDMTRVITPDKPITAVLTYQIDTRQTVTAVATVDRDIYGSSGRTVVIPRGTKVIGRVGGGATDRVGIAWKQIIRPDGVRFVFDGESGDAMGRGGVPGQINNRYLQRYGYSLLPAIASAGVTALLGGQNSQAAGTNGTVQTQDARAVAAQILQQPLQQITQDLMTKNMTIPVQITIPAGTRITIWSVGDLRLKPPGEEEPEPRGVDRPSNGQAQTGFGSAPRQNSFGFANQGQSSNAPAAPSASGSSGQTSSGTSNSASDDAASLQVGRVDENGNYIAPGATAPAPAPIARNTNNATNRAFQAQNNNTMPANSNPWQ